MGLGMGSGGGGGTGGGGGGLSLFGLRTRGTGLAGTFYDLKQTPGRQPTNIAEDDKPRHLSPAASKEYQKAVAQFVTDGMNDGALASRYFKGPDTLYATQILIPRMSAKEGPKAFNLEARVQPSRWIVHYKGAVIRAGERARTISWACATTYSSCASTTSSSWIAAACFPPAAAEALLTRSTAWTPCWAAGVVQGLRGGQPL